MATKGNMHSNRPKRTTNMSRSNKPTWIIRINNRFVTLINHFGRSSVLVEGGGEVCTTSVRLAHRSLPLPVLT